MSETIAIEANIQEGEGKPNPLLSEKIKPVTGRAKIAERKAKDALRRGRPLSYQLIPKADEGALSDKEVKLRSIIQHLRMLPPNELSYYMALMIAIIEKEPSSAQSILLLEKGDELVLALKQFYTHQAKAAQQEKPFDAHEDLKKINESLQALLKESQLRTFSHQLKKIVLAACSIVLGFIIGVVASVVGLVIGLFSDYTIIGNFHKAYLGFVAGLGLGVFVGSRIPDVLFQSKFERKMEVAINGIEKVVKQLPDRRSEQYYAQLAKDFILDNFFPNAPKLSSDLSEEERKRAEALRNRIYNEFLGSQQAYQVSTTSSRFIDKEYKGNLGQHTLICYEINGKAFIPIEFFGDKIKTPSFVDQFETPRIVSGRKLAQMIALDFKMMETHEYTASFIFKHYSLGDEDCRNYGEKDLVCTGQMTTKISRFSEHDKWYGKNLVKPTITFFSKLREDELTPFVKHYDDGKNNPTIKAHKWAPANKSRPVPKEWLEAEKSIEPIIPKCMFGEEEEIETPSMGM